MTYVLRQPIENESEISNRQKEISRCTSTEIELKIFGFLSQGKSVHIGFLCIITRGGGGER